MIKNDPKLGNCIWTGRTYKGTISVSWKCHTLGFPECNDSSTLWDTQVLRSQLLKEILAASFRQRLLGKHLLLMSLYPNGSWRGKLFQELLQGLLQRKICDAAWLTSCGPSIPYSIAGFWYAMCQSKFKSKEILQRTELCWTRHRCPIKTSKVISLVGKIKVK